MADRPRVIVVLPNAAESAEVADWLVAEGLEPVLRSAPRAAEEMRDRPFALLISDAASAIRGGLQAQGRARNPHTVTILVGESEAGAQAMSSQAMFLTRPIDRATLTCFVSMALMDGRPARRSVRKSINRFDALVNGVPSHLLDVSAEGLRLEVGKDRRAVLGPYFKVKVPLVGVTVTVQRMWTRASSNGVPTLWYGGALTQNQANVDQAWRTFVDTVPVAAGLQTNP
ncbi:MAG TPA: hypothetical protein VFO58_16040 [Vicinamibacterales bacterium]|nr:hypothetical protein [Vicinamibacterales bacterium]